jgi:hypothetical protein
MEARARIPDAYLVAIVQQLLANGSIVDKSAVGATEIGDDEFGAPPFDVSVPSRHEFVAKMDMVVAGPANADACGRHSVALSSHLEPGAFPLPPGCIVR